MKNQISEKKLFMMLSTELFAMTSLILPAVLVGFAGKNGIPVLLAASGGLLLLAVWYLTCYRRKEKSPEQILKEEGTMVRVLVKGIYVVRYFLHGLFLMVIFVNLIKEVLLPEYHFFWILFPVLFVLFMMTGKQLRVRGRILEVLFPYIFIPLLLVLLLALFQLDYQTLPEQLWGGAELGAKQSFLYQVYGILLFYQPVEFLLFLLPALREGGDKRKNSGASRVVGAAGLFVVSINVIMYVAAVGMFGSVRTGESLWSALYIMQSVRLPGRFVERLDILFLVFWIFSTFALLSAYMYYGSRFVVAESAEEKQSLPDNKISRYYTVLWLLGILLLTLLIREPRTMFEFFVPYKMWVDFPLAVLVPLFLYRKKDRKRGKKGISVALMAILCGVLMTGCQDRADIEDRNYVMTIGIEEGEKKQFRIIYEIADLSLDSKDGGGRKGKLLFYEADSLKEAEETDRIRDDKKLDYGHIKAILFSKELLENRDARNRMIEELEQFHSIAGTTLLFVTQGKLKTVMEAGGKKASSFGEYVDQMITNQKPGAVKEDTLAKLLREESEQTGNRKICMINLDGEQLVLQSGTIWSGLNRGKESILPKLKGLLVKAEGADRGCMLYPSICLSDDVIEKVSKDEQEQPGEEGDKQGSEDLFVPQENRIFHIKWKLVEWFSALWSK